MMECITKIQTIQQIEPSELNEDKNITSIKKSNTYDEEARKHRKYLAEQEALRQLEQIKTQAFMVFKR